MWPKLRPHLPYLLIISLVCLFLTRYIWSTRSWIETHDGIFHVIRLTEMTEMVRLGHFPVRWAGSLDNGFGLPLFNYVYPGPYYFALPLTLLGLSAKWAVKLLLIAFYLLGGLGVYALFAKKKPLALVVSLLYLTTPYLLLNLFVRGAVGEFLAICLFPFALLSLRHLTAARRLRWYHPLPYFLLFVTHNFLSFLFLPIYLLYALSLRRLKPALLSLVLSLGLAAFFLVPMLTERQYLFSVANRDFTYTYLDHFLYPRQLLYSAWGQGYSVVGAGDQLSFQLGLPHLVLLALSLYLLVKRRAGRQLVLWLLILSGVIFFTLPISRPAWQLLSPLQIIQFPWRFLALSTLACAFLNYSALSLIKSGRTRSFFLLGLVLVGLAAAYLYSTPSYLQNPAQFTEQLYIHRYKTTTSSRRELLPRWSSPEEKWKGGEEVRIVSGQAALTLIDSTPLSLTLDSQTQDPQASYIIRRHYFPAWRIVGERGQVLSVKPDSAGEIVFSPETGVHQYRLEFVSTPLEKLGNWLTIITIFTIIGSTYAPLRSHQT